MRQSSTAHISLWHCCLPRCYKNIPLNFIYDIQWFSIPEFQTLLHCSPKQSQRSKSHVVRCITPATHSHYQFLSVSASVSWIKDPVRTNLQERGCIYLMVAGHTDVPPQHGSHVWKEPFTLHMPSRESNECVSACSVCFSIRTVQNPVPRKSSRPWWAVFPPQHNKDNALQTPSAMSLSLDNSSKYAERFAKLTTLTLELLILTLRAHSLDLIYTTKFLSPKAICCKQFQNMSL